MFLPTICNTTRRSSSHSAGYLDPLHVVPLNNHRSLRCHRAAASVVALPAAAIVAESHCAQKERGSQQREMRQQQTESEAGCASAKKLESHIAVGEPTRERQRS